MKNHLVKSRVFLSSLTIFSMQYLFGSSCPDDGAPEVEEENAAFRQLPSSSRGGGGSVSSFQGLLVLCAKKKKLVIVFRVLCRCWLLVFEFAVLHRTLVVLHTSLSCVFHSTLGDCLHHGLATPPPALLPGTGPFFLSSLYTHLNHHTNLSRTPHILSNPA